MMTITVWRVKVAPQVAVLLPLQAALRVQVAPVLPPLLRRRRPLHHPQVLRPQALVLARAPVAAPVPARALVAVPVPARLQVRKQTIEIEKESLRKTKAIILRNKKRREQRLTHDIIVSLS